MSEKVLMKGNEAIAEAAILAGCRHYFGYPITPQTEVAAYMAKKMPKIGGTFLQAESEIAAINMVYGVSSAGLRVMTSSSSPGISLKGEGLSYLAGADLPALVVNVQRGGPGLGGIQPSQSDYFQATRGGGHGDYHMIVLAPASVQEMAELTVKGFELADQYRMTSMILADGTMGQMMEPVALDFKVAPPPEKPWATTGTGMKRPHNIVNSLFLQPEELEKFNFERYERYRKIEETEARFEEYRMDDAEICIAAFGIAARVSRNAIDEARRQGVKAGMIRPITLWPFPKEAFRRAAGHVKAFISVELSMGQMIEDVELATRCARPVSLVNRAGGVIPSPEEVLAKINEINALCEKALKAQAEQLTKNHAAEMNKVFESVIAEGEKMEKELAEAATKNAKMYKTAQKLYESSAKLNSILLEAVRKSAPEKKMTRYATAALRAVESLRK